MIVVPKPCNLFFKTFLIKCLTHTANVGTVWIWRNLDLLLCEKQQLTNKTHLVCFCILTINKLSINKHMFLLSVSTEQFDCQSTVTIWIPNNWNPNIWLFKHICCPVFRWADHQIRQTIQIPDILDHKTDIFVWFLFRSYPKEAKQLLKAAE